MDQDNPYKPPEASLSTRDTVGRQPYEGLRGWLILVGIGVTLAPIRVTLTTFQTCMDVFANGKWDAITIPLMKPFIIVEIVTNMGMAIGATIAAYFFYTKNRNFPKLYIGIQIFSLILILLDAEVASRINPEIPMFDPETNREITRALIGTLIWVPYMLVSKRVKATFVR